MPVFNLHSYAQIKIALCFFILYLAYCFLYAHIGLDNNDFGFMLGLSYQFFQGAELYKDILYVRPPLSVVLHSFIFSSIFESAPILISRFWVYAQIACYSWVASVIAAHVFKLSVQSFFLLAILSFMFNAHNFSPIAWHTTDGIFFGVLAIYFALKSKGNAYLFYFIAFTLSILSALCKQPFYIIPLLVFLLINYTASLRQLLVSSFFLVLSLAFVYFSILSLFDVNSMKVYISAQTSVSDLFNAGFLNYLLDWVDIRVVLSVAPLSFLLVYMSVHDFTNKPIINISLLRFCFVCATFFFILSILYTFTVSENRISLGSMFDALFIVTAALSLIYFFLTWSEKWLMLVILHAISWASSISWGYTTVSFFFTPVLIFCLVISSRLFEGYRFSYHISCFAAVCSFLSFYAGHGYVYSLEGSVTRSSSTAHLGDVFPVFRGIYVQPEQVKMWDELKYFNQKYVGRNTVGPNWPLYNVVFAGRNPLGIDWLLNAEIGSFQSLINTRLQNVDYFFVFRNAKPSPYSDGKFGSAITLEVIQSWKLEDASGAYFDVYRNPNLSN